MNYKGVLFYAFEKQVREAFFSTLFYVLVIFTLLQQVYLERVVASSRQNQAQIVPVKPSMAEMTMDLVDKEAGAFSFLRDYDFTRLRVSKRIVRVASKGQIKTYRYVKNKDRNRNYHSF